MDKMNQMNMTIKLSSLLLLLFLLNCNSFAYKVIEDVAATGGGYDIPIRICIADQSSGKMPVMFFVHGGGWNGGDEKAVPPASIPADCDFLCDEMGIIYVGLAYRCKGNNATFHEALQDLEASIAWFESRAYKFDADMSRIGFSGGSAGTTLSAVLSQRYPNCVLYVGSEGMYNIVDRDSTKSSFPDAASRADVGLVTYEQKMDASPYYQVREHPPYALLRHGKDDWLCHYSQSQKYKEKIEAAGGACRLILYEGINHTCLNLSYPEVFENSLMAIARHYADGYGIQEVDFRGIERAMKRRTRALYPYQSIPDYKIKGSWKSARYGTFTFFEDGTGEFVSGNGGKPEMVTYQNNGSWFAVRVWSEDRERRFYLRLNDQVIYELITEENRYKSRRNDYRKI